MNFRGIALSSIYCKLLDNIILETFHDKLCTSDQQFSFKPKSSTNMCTMVLKETSSYYSSNQSSVYCTYLDAINQSVRLFKSGISNRATFVNVNVIRYFTCNVSFLNLMHRW